MFRDDRIEFDEERRNGGEQMHPRILNGGAARNRVNEPRPSNWSGTYRYHAGPRGWFTTCHATRVERRGVKRGWSCAPMPVYVPRQRNYASETAPPSRFAFAPILVPPPRRIFVCTQCENPWRRPWPNGTTSVCGRWSQTSFPIELTSNARISRCAHWSAATGKWRNALICTFLEILFAKHRLCSTRGKRRKREIETLIWHLHARSIRFHELRVLFKFLRCITMRRISIKMVEYTLN